VTEKRTLAKTDAQTGQRRNKSDTISTDVPTFVNGMSRDRGALHRLLVGGVVFVIYRLSSDFALSGRRA
jgi:hypothetical protein